MYLVLCINSGSSSLKFQLMDVDSGEVVAKGLAEKIGEETSFLSLSSRGGPKATVELPLGDHGAAIQAALESLTREDTGAIESLSAIDAVGHRLVHGGARFTTSTIIDAEVEAAIEELIPLAPLHNPANLTGVRACRRVLPDVPHVAVFDTSFFSTLPEAAYTYAIPLALRDEHQVRRWGFHGTSHRYVASAAAELLGRPVEELKLITCHLGNGASITATRHGEAVETSMGFTPLEGLVMGTRSGDLDPAAALHLMDVLGLDTAGMTRLLNRESGVLGISGLTNDMRTLRDESLAGNERAKLALDVYHHRIVKYIGAYHAVLGGADAVVFTAGIGENGPEVREGVMRSLGGLGMVLDPERNLALPRGGTGIISTDDSPITICVVPTDEERMIALDTRTVAQGL